MEENFFHKFFTGIFRMERSLLLPLMVGVVGLILIVYGLIQYLASGSSSDSLEFGTTESATDSAQISSFFMVDVEGAVVRPGVYKLSEDARLQDALIAAGGLAQTADRQAVAKRFNLASKLSDGVKIYIPAAGEQTSSSTQGALGVQSSAESSTQNSESGLVSINTASESQLDTLPGIGPVTAGKIITGRPYGTIDELRDKKIVTQSVFEKIKDKISL